MTKEADFVSSSEKIKPGKEKHPILRKEFQAFLFFYYGLHAVSGDLRKYILADVGSSAVMGLRRSMGADSKTILSPFAANVNGLENVPRSGPVLVCANHWKDGPYNGNWIHYALSDAMYQAREEERDLRIIMQNGMLFPHIPFRIPHTKRYAEMIGDMYDFILVTPFRQIESGKESSPISEVKKIIKAFRDDQMIGLYPEARESKQFRPGHPSAGAVAWSLSQTREDALVLPVGVHANKKDVLSLRVGKPYPISEIAWAVSRTDSRLKERTYGRISQYMMEKIEPLVPSWAFA
ncbi:hypothetical protein HY382_02225 [Candidatus Curtissbacteria bacterium]|nr:hypothetical protein [Candidatus Curtissbacteria bacterium]